MLGFVRKQEFNKGGLIMLIPLVPRIWVTITGKTLRIIEDGTMEIVLEKEQNPEKEFFEIERVEGDIGKLVDLAIKSYIEKAVRETEKEFKSKLELASKDIADKYKEMIEFYKERLEEYEFKSATTSTEGSHGGYYICRPPILKTFELPTREELLDIKPGDFVNLIFASDEVVKKERLWVEVIKIVETYGYGKLSDNPVYITNLSPNDLITFHLSDVIKIMKDFRKET